LAEGININAQAQRKYQNSRLHRFWRFALIIEIRNTDNKVKFDF
jgi:hypothetical protein